MSTRFVVAAVAAVVVGYFAGPQAGFATFSLVYGVTGFLDPNAKVQGPRLNDLKFPAASYGSPIPYVEGHPRLGGIIAWSIDPKREVATTTVNDGKGGPGVDSTTFTYEVDMRIILCENTGYRPRRCWSNGALIWSAADNADAETLQASAETVSWREMRIYTGEDDQMPDPTEEAYVGTGLSPAYRGRSSIVLVGLSCGQSGQLPVLTWEISNGTPVQVQGDGLLCHFDEMDGSQVLSAIGPNLTPTGGSVLTATDPKFGAQSGAQGGSIFDTFTATGVTGRLNRAWRAEGFFYPTEGQMSLFRLGNDGVFPTVAIGTLTTFGYAAFASFITAGGSGSGSFGDVADGLTLNQWGHAAVQFDGVNVLAIYMNGKRVGIIDSGASYGADDVFSSITIGNCTRKDEFYFHFLDASSDDPADAIWTDVYDVPTEQFVASNFYTVDAPEPTHAEALTRQWERAGLDPALLDVSAPALSTLKVRALAISQLSPPRTTMDNLAAAGLYEFVETGDGVKVVMRGGAAVKTIAYEDLGAFNGDTPPDPLPRTRGNELEVTSQVSIKFANVDDDYRDGTETSTRLATGSSIVTVAEVPMGLTPTEAKRLADVAVTDALSSIMRIGPVVLTRKHADIEPTDVVIFTGKDGSTYRTRITKRTEGAGLITLEGVEDDATVIDSAAVTSGGYTSTSSVGRISDTDATLIDGPILSDADDSRGIYVAAKPTGAKWRGYALLKSDDGTEFASVLTGTARAVKGTCSVVPGAWAGGYVFNEADSIVCDLGLGTVASATRAQILASEATNAFLIGAPGRWMFGQFRDAELTAPGVYRLTGLLLGGRGTEHNIGTQVAGDEIVMLSSGGVQRLGQDADDLGVARYYKAVSNGKSVGSTASETFTDAEVGLKPFAPVHLRKSITDGSTQVSWTPRTRYATRFASPLGIYFPTGEATESYTVDLFNPSDVLVSSETVTSPTWSASGLANLGSFTYASRDLKMVGGDAIGIDILSEKQSSTGQVHMCQFDATSGALILISAAAMGNSCEQWTSIGDEIYAATTDYYAISGSLRASHVHRLTRGVMNIEATFDATYTPGTSDGFISGVAADGTDVWITEYFSGTLRKLDPSTLASVATYSLGAGISEIQYDSGSLWIVNRDTHEMIEWDIATTSEVNRFDLNNPGGPTKVIGGLLFNFGGPIGGGVGSALYVYNKTTGALVNTINTLSGRGSLVELGGYVVCQANGPTLHFIDSATGLSARTVDASDLGYYANADGSDGTNLYVTTYAVTGTLIDTYIVDLDAADLTGYSVTVYQNGAIGRGYPATLEL